MYKLTALLLSCFACLGLLHAQVADGWTELHPFTGEFQSLHFVDDDHGAVAGNSAGSLTVAVTADGGLTWQVSSLGDSAHWASVDMRAPLHVCVAANGGGLYHSMDGGVTWSGSANSWAAAPQEVTDVEWAADSVVYVFAGEAGLVLRSADLGGSWDTVLATAPGLMWQEDFKMAFSSADTGILNPDYQHLLRTTNGGISWDTLASTLSSDLYSIRCWGGDDCMAFMRYMFYQVELSSGAVALSGLNSLGCHWDFVDADTGYGGAAYTPWGSSASVGEFRRTTDGGTANLLIGSSTTDMFNGPMDFTSTMVGYRLAEVSPGIATDCKTPYHSLLKTEVGAMATQAPLASSALRLIPNPATASVEVCLESQQPGTAITLIDGLGREWHPQASPGAPGRIWVGLEGVPAGIYIVKIEGTGTATDGRLRLVVQ